MELKKIINYLDCPRKYSLEEVGATKILSDNTQLKIKVKEAVMKKIKEDISYDKFVEIVGANDITHGKTTVNMRKLYLLLEVEADKLKDNIVTVSLRTPTNGYEQSLYYNISQVINYGNKELTFACVILNTTPKVDIIKLPPRTEEQVKEINDLLKSVERAIQAVEKEKLAYIKRPNNITCAACEYNKECKPICFYKED